MQRFMSSTNGDAAPVAESERNHEGVRDRLRMLKRDRFRGNATAMAETVEINKSTLTRVLSGDTETVTDHVVSHVLNNVENEHGDGLRAPWLEFGSGPRWEGQVENEEREDDVTDTELQLVQEVEVGAGDEMAVVNSGLKMPKRWIRQAFGIRPDRLCTLRVRGDSMLDTLRPGQRLMAAQWEGQNLEDGTVYGLRGPLGFTVKRLRFDRVDDEPVIWVWADNPEYSDHRHYLSRGEFEDEYTVFAKALEVGQKL